MKKFFSLFIALVILFTTTTVFAEAPSASVDKLFTCDPYIQMNTNVDISKTAYSLIIKYYSAFLIVGLGPNFLLDEVAILYLDNMYQLVTFDFPIDYPQTTSVMAIFFGSNIWIRTGVVLSDGKVVFDMTEVYGNEVEMFVFSNYDV